MSHRSALCHFLNRLPLLNFSVTDFRSAPLRGQLEDLDAIGKSFGAGASIFAVLGFRLPEI